MPVRVIIADGNAFFRTAIKEALQTSPGCFFEVVGEAADGPCVLKMIDSRKPHLLILDLHLPQANGFESLKKLKEKHPSLKLLVMALESDADYMTRALETGADAYCSKYSGQKEFVDGLGAIMEDLGLPLPS